MKNSFEKTCNNIYALMSFVFDNSEENLRKSMPRFTSIGIDKGLNYQMISSVKQVLVNRKLAYEIDKTLFWNPQMARPNPEMASSVYSAAAKLNTAKSYQYRDAPKATKMFTDEQLVAMLRDRGYTVTATKEVQVQQTKVVEL